MFLIAGRRPVFAAVVLVLITTMVMATGCVSPGFDNQTHALPEEKYVLLTHDIDFKVVSQSGICFNTTGGVFDFPVQFNEKNGVLTVRSPPFNKDQINKSLVLFYVSGVHKIYEEGDNNTGNWGYTRGKGVYSIPAELSGEVVIDTVSEDGTIALRYDGRPIILKQSERWENITRRFENETLEDFTRLKAKDFIRDNQTNKTSIRPDLEEDLYFRCYKEILVTDRIQNVGFFDKRGIVFV